MNTLIVHPANDGQEKTLKAFLEALEVEYDEQPLIDETEHILANPDLVEKLIEGRKICWKEKVKKLIPTIYGNNFTASCGKRFTIFGNIPAIRN